MNYKEQVQAKHRTGTKRIGIRCIFRSISVHSYPWIWLLNCILWLN